MKAVKGKNKKKVVKSNALNRLAGIGTLICFIFVALIIRLGYIVFVKGNEYKDKADTQWNQEVQVTAKRGDILDRNGKHIAASAKVYRVDFDIDALLTEAEEKEIDINDIAQRLATTLEMGKDEVLDIIESGEAYPNLIRGIEQSKASEIKALEIYGVTVGNDVKRYYPNGNYLAQVLGSVNTDGQGLTGVELEYNQYLAGISGLKVEGVDSNQNTMPFVPYKFTPAIDGKNVVLTIDENIQYFAEKVAEKGLAEHKAKGVSILVMNPNTGEILAMANKPDYDPNEPLEGYESFTGSDDSEKIQSMWRNSLVNNIFEPGSTFKAISMIAAMEEGVVSESDTFNCTGSLKFGSTSVHCWELNGHGVQTLPEILKNSCNVGFMMLGEKLGKVKLNEYIKKLGFGRATGIDLPGEALGIVKETDDISEIDLGTIAFGQTNSVTAIQLMTAFNAIANGGSLIQPHIVKEISHTDRSGNTIVDEVIEPTIKKNVLSEDKTAILRGYLERTATQDGEPGSFVQGYDIGAKSGTAEKYDPEIGGYSNTKYIASMIALAPVENPEITVFVAVDEPSTGKYYGGQVAAPLTKELFKMIFDYIESPLANNGYSLARDIIVPDVRGMSKTEAEQILSDNGLKVKVSGKGDSVISMDPYPGTTIKEGSEVEIATRGSNID
ncbi:MAG: stage V sporulation protein D, partial [Peptostreptococcaceae bacterium]